MENNKNSGNQDQSSEQRNNPQQGNKSQQGQGQGRETGLVSGRHLVGQIIHGRTSKRVGF